MYFTGFADEAGDSIETQIKATRALGWRHIEARNIGGVNITDISERDFDHVCSRLKAAGIRVNCIGSAVANWSKDPRREADFESSLAELGRAIPRMQCLGTRMLRGMSFMLVKDRPPDDPEIEKLVFDRVRHLVQLCESAGIIYVHENCMTYGGQSPAHTLKLIAAVDSTAFRLVFDTGNPVFSDLRTGAPPYRKQDAWDFYTQIKPFIVHVHIKDGRHLADTDDLFPDVHYTYPGQGDADVPRIVADLLQSGYDGGFSIEPHMNVVLHDKTPTEAAAHRYDTYIAYGRRCMQLVDAARQRVLTQRPDGG